MATTSIKRIAPDLRAKEDLCYYSFDNLPDDVLEALVICLREHLKGRVYIYDLQVYTLFSMVNRRVKTITDVSRVAWSRRTLAASGYNLEKLCADKRLRGLFVALPSFHITREPPGPLYSVRALYYGSHDHLQMSQILRSNAILTSLPEYSSLADDQKAKLISSDRALIRALRGVARHLFQNVKEENMPAKFPKKYRAHLLSTLHETPDDEDLFLPISAMISHSSQLPSDGELYYGMWMATRTTIYVTPDLVFEVTMSIWFNVGVPDTVEGVARHYVKCDCPTPKCEYEQTSKPRVLVTQLTPAKEWM